MFSYFGNTQNSGVSQTTAAMTPWQGMFGNGVMGQTMAYVQARNNPANYQLTEANIGQMADIESAGGQVDASTFAMENGGNYTGPSGAGIFAAACIQFVKDASAAYSGYLQAQAFKRQQQLQAASIRVQGEQYALQASAYEVKAHAYLAQAEGYRAQSSSYDAEAALLGLQADTSDNAMYSVYTAGEWQAMERGLADAQNISKLRTEIAHRGVKLNEGSAGEAEASARMAAKYNQIAIQKNTTEAAMMYYAQANSYRSQQIMHEGASGASLKMAESAETMSEAQKTLAKASLKMQEAMEKQAQAAEALTAGTRKWRSALIGFGNSTMSQFGYQYNG